MQEQSHTFIFKPDDDYSSPSDPLLRQVNPVAAADVPLRKQWCYRHDTINNCNDFRIRFAKEVLKVAMSGLFTQWTDSSSFRSLEITLWRQYISWKWVIPLKQHKSENERSTFASPWHLRMTEFHLVVTLMLGISLALWVSECETTVQSLINYQLLNIVCPIDTINNIHFN